MRTASVILLFVFSFTAARALGSDALVSLLESHGSELLKKATVKGRSNSQAVYARFAKLVAAELEEAGHEETAIRISRSIENPGRYDTPRAEIAWITQTFAREFYQDEIINRTGELIRFKTYATDVPNRFNPEFIEQKNYLRALAEDLGLHYNDVDGFIQEIWIGEGEESFGIICHSDVQPVDETEWERDPWSGEIINGALWGRGAVDDKGPIVAVMYGMRALLDSGIPLKKKILLLVGTDEESANEDVSTYLKTHSAPTQTIVVDSNYPVVCAEKGWCGFWLQLARDSTPPEGKGLLIGDLRSGFSPSIVPEKATAKLVPIGLSSAESRAILESTRDTFVKKRHGGRLSIEVLDDTLVVRAFGKSVHSSRPETGHNALMDLLVYLDSEVKPLRNEFALMARFAATYIGFELHGHSLGIAHRDEFMGDVTVAGDMFHAADSAITFMFNIRIPRGIDPAAIEDSLTARFQEFNDEHGTELAITSYIGSPLYNDPNSPFVQRLLRIYNSVTGENRKAQSIGGGTYAHRIPNAVVFGPAMPDEDYLGHQPNEYIKISTLVRNIEILTHTLVEFGM